MFRYRLHSPDGDDLGEATYAMMIKPGEEIHGNGGERLRVLPVVRGCPTRRHPCKTGVFERRIRDSNPCRRRERAVS